MKMVWIQLALGLFQVDQAFKQEVEDNPYFGQEHMACGGRVRLKRLHNHGMAGGRLAGHPEGILRVCALATLASAGMLLGLLREKGHTASKLGFSLLTGGALSNLYDRCKRGYVVDYVGFELPIKRLGRLLFNLADFFILAGALLVCFGQADHAKG